MDKHKTRTKKEPATASGKWAWQETGDAEFEVRRRKETHYRIFRLAGKNRTRPKKVPVYKFWAKSRNEVLSVLKAYSEDHPGETYYYSTSGYHVRGDGTRHDDLDDVLFGSGSKRGRAESEAARRRFVAERKRIYAAIRAFFGSLKTRDPYLRGMIGDFSFFVRHYDMVSGILSWIAQTIGTWNDGAATKSWQAGQAIASGADYTETVRNMLKDIWDESDSKNRRLWPNFASVDNFITPSHWHNPDTEFTSPGFLYMENP